MWLQPLDFGLELLLGLRYRGCRFRSGPLENSITLLFGFLPRPLLTPDQVKQLKLGNVITSPLPGLHAFGITPTAAEGIVGSYLKRYRPVQQNKRLRLAPR